MLRLLFILVLALASRAAIAADMYITQDHAYCIRSLGEEYAKLFASDDDGIKQYGAEACYELEKRLQNIDVATIDAQNAVGVQFRLDCTAGCIDYLDVVALRGSQTKCFLQNLDVAYVSGSDSDVLKISTECAR